jgi:hypothetical protein
VVAVPQGTSRPNGPKIITKTGLPSDGDLAAWQADALLHHTDRGDQYTSKRFQRLMADNSVVYSMSRHALLPMTRERWLKAKTQPTPQVGPIHPGIRGRRIRACPRQGRATGDCRYTARI